MKLRLLGLVGDSGIVIVSVQRPSNFFAATARAGAPQAGPPRQKETATAFQCGNHALRSSLFLLLPGTSCRAGSAGSTRSP